ncbi:hypothetical protein JL722_11060 [Aureococcus anophagefferens]|nr:hypothetical protein JL722_11060 [Aureococcus anophagefferens]
MPGGRCVTLPLLVALATLPARTSCNGGCSDATHTRLDVTLVTQCSVDRLWVVKKLCERWHGPLSLAVGSAPDGEPVERLRGRARDYMALCTERHVAVVVAPLRPYPVNALRNRAWAMATTSHVLLLDVDFWPSVGARRRIVGALRALPESGERRALVLPALELTLQRSETKNPAKVLEQAEFERQIPSSKLGLLRCVANGAEGGAPLRWKPTRASHWEDPISTRSTAAAPRDAAHRRRREAPGAHRTIVKRVPFRPTMKPTTPALSPARSGSARSSTRCRRSSRTRRTRRSRATCAAPGSTTTARRASWTGSSTPTTRRRWALDCFLGNHFEPFAVARRCDEATPRNGSARVPRFDERFTGYGKNKIEWISSLRGADYAFYTVGAAFAVHVPHLQSAAKKEWDRSFKKKNATHRAAGTLGHKGYVDDLFKEHLRGLGLYDKADVGHWFRASGAALEYTRSSLRADGAPTLREDDVATPLCAASKATVDFLEDLDMRRFAEVAKACVLDAATCAAGGFARETRDAWRAIADATRAPFLDRMTGALAADADAEAAAAAAAAASLMEGKQGRCCTATPSAVSSNLSHLQASRILRFRRSRRRLPCANSQPRSIASRSPDQVAPSHGNPRGPRAGALFGA